MPSKYNTHRWLLWYCNTRHCYLFFRKQWWLCFEVHRNRSNKVCADMFLLYWSLSSYWMSHKVYWYEERGGGGWGQNKSTVSHSFVSKMHDDYSSYWVTYLTFYPSASLNHVFVKTTRIWLWPYCNLNYTAGNHMLLSLWGVINHKRAPLMHQPLIFHHGQL